MALDTDSTHPLRSVSTAWIGKIDRAIKHKKTWQDVADECERFFSASTGWLWDPKNKAKFWGTESGEVSPRFKLTVARAFELVALFGPTLYWRNPIRYGEPRPMADIPPELFQDVNDPVAQQLQQMATQEYSKEYPSRRLRAELMTRYLNWTPNVLSLAGHAELAITQALVAGRGLLWTLPYQPPGSDKVIVGSFFDPVENLAIDPDAESIDDAWWVAKKCTEPVWKIERDRGFNPGDLSKFATIESGNQQGTMTADPLANIHRATGQSHDLMVYWKVWSRCGMARISDLKSELSSKLDEVVGDYAYMEVASGCPFFLNMPTEKLTEATTDDVAKSFRWPCPFWKIDRWPFSYLDFYRRPKHAWPIAPLAPGLGELKAIQVLFSHMVNKVWMTQRDFIAYQKSASEEVKRIIEEGKDLSFLPLEQINGSINDVIQFLQHPPINADAYRMLEMLGEGFDRRTGLSDLLYGIQQVQSRSATDVKIREQMTNIRPEYMASKTEEFMSAVAKNEALATRWFVTGYDVQDLLGQTGSYLWKQQIEDVPVERTIFEIDYRIEAGSGQRPNQAKDMGNLSQFIQTFGPILDKHADMTGDISQLNSLIERWGKSAQMDVQGLMMGQRPNQQPPSPEEQQQQVQQQQQAELQMEQQKAQIQVQAKQAEGQGALQLKQYEIQGNQQLKQVEVQTQITLDAQRHQQELKQAQEKHQVEMVQAIQKANLEAVMDKQKVEAAKQQANVQRDQARVKLAQAKKKPPKAAPR
jgi:hypothetical protein